MLDVWIYCHDLKHAKSQFPPLVLRTYALLYETGVNEPLAERPQNRNTWHIQTKENQVQILVYELNQIEDLINLYTY